MKALKIFFISIGGIIIIGFLALIVVAASGPETYVYLGKQLPKKYANEIRTLGLLGAGEKVKYFYSDALSDIEDGMYFVTDRNLVLYSRSWDEPKTIIHFEDIVKIEAEYDDSMFNDSVIQVTTASGLNVSFPVSSEHGRDRDFVRYIQKKSHIGEAGPVVNQRGTARENL